MIEKVMNQPREVRILLNSALISILAWRIISERYERDGEGTHFGELLVLLCFLFHAPTREALPRSLASKFSLWLRENQQIRIGLAARARGLKPFLAAGILVAADQGFLSFDNRGRVIPGERRPRGFLSSGNDKLKDMDKKARYLGNSVPSVKPLHSFLTLVGLSI